MHFLDSSVSFFFFNAKLKSVQKMKAILKVVSAVWPTLLIMPSDTKLRCKDSITKIRIQAPNLIPSVKDNKC